MRKPEEVELLNRNQLVGIILLDCVEKCNSAGYPDEETYDLALRAMLKERGFGEEDLRDLVR